MSLLHGIGAKIRNITRKESYIKKSLAVAAIVGSLGVATLAGAGMVNAQSGTPNSNGLVDKIAQKFNLNKSDVQKVFDEDRTAHEAKRQQQMEERMTQAVKDGKLTQAQADAITSKMAEMKTYMDSLKDKTEQERHDAMKTKMDELKQWADQNNIPNGYMPMGHGMRGGPRPDHDGDGPDDSQPSTPSSSTSQTN